MKTPSAVSFFPGILFVLAFVSTSFTVVRGNDTHTRQEKLNGGYYLLHQLGQDEAQLPLLLDVKDAPATIEKFTISVSKTAKESNALLDQMQDKDPALKLDQNPLPAIEQDVRDSIQDEKAHELLYGTSGGAFVRALLVSQIEASSYGHNLAKVLAEQESDPNRIKCLEKISAQWEALHTEAFRLLSAVR